MNTGRLFTLSLWFVSAAMMLGPKEAHCQAPTARWQQNLGGAADDLLFAAQPTADGGWIVGGSSSSPAGGNKTSTSYGGKDFWVVRLDASGAKVWDKSFGGAGDDLLFSVQQTEEGGFVLGGYSASAPGGNKTSANYGLGDMWIIRLDASGNKIWEQTCGGTGEDGLFAVQQTGDGGFVCAGYSYSTAGGNKNSANFGGSDFWLVRLDANGAKLWDKSYGGADDDTCYSLQQVTNGIVLAGASLSVRGGGKTSVNYGGTDFWLVRTDASGNKLWDQSYGGTGEDGVLSVSVLPTGDGGFLLGGDSTSKADGTKTSPAYGQEDFWVVRVDSTGKQLWDRSFGGTGSDLLTGMQPGPNGGFVLAGGSSSGVTGNKTSASFGGTDFWVVGIDSAGSKLWEQDFGGDGFDGNYNVSLAAAPDGGFLVAGDSTSGATGNKTNANLGGIDFWAVKLDSTSAPKLWPEPTQDLAGKGFLLWLQGTAGHTYVTEFTTNYVNWSPFSTNQVTGAAVEIVDPYSSSARYRFYRAREQ